MYIKIKIIIFLSLFTIVESESAFSQVPLLKWALSFGDGSVNNIRSMGVDKLGNVYTTGIFTLTNDFDPGLGTFYLTAKGDYDIFISKCDSNGNFIWARNMGGLTYEEPHALALDDSGNVYTIGRRQGTGDYNPSPNDSFILTGTGFFISKLTTNGDFVFAKALAGPEGNAIAVDSVGDIYITGKFGGSIDFNPSPTDTFFLNYNTGTASYILKLNRNGNFLWAKNFNGASEGWGITIDKFGNVYSTGVFSGTTDFDPSVNDSFKLTSAGLNDVFVNKLDSLGKFLWARNMGGNADDIGTSIITDEMNNVYTLGNFKGTADFDPGPSTFSFTTSPTVFEDIFISKLNSSGDFVWAKRIGGSQIDLGNSLAIDSKNKLYITGVFQGGVDFNPGSGTFNMFSSFNSKDIFVEKLDTSGNFLWAVRMGSAADDIGINVKVGKSSNVYTTGTYTGTVDFDPGGTTYFLTPTGGSAIFIQNIRQCIPNVSFNSFSSCDSININNLIYYSSGLYVQHVNNTSGCDSTINLFLTINHSVSDTLVFDVCDSLVFNNIIYKTSGFYLQKFSNSKGCDSTIVMDLTIKKSTSNFLNVTTCDSFRLLNKIFISSGVYNFILKNSTGCDSFLTLNLSVNKGSTSQLFITACDTFKFNTIVYTSGGVYTHKFTSVSGCDSIIILNLIINKSSLNNLNVTACNSYSINSQKYDSSGVYVLHHLNRFGCDSNILLNLTISKVDTMVTQNGSVFTANEPAANYQWLDCSNMLPILGEIFRSFSAKKTGDYAVIITKNSCTDTSACLPISINGMNDFEILKKLNIFPNPVLSYLYLRGIKEMAISNINLIDIYGNVLLKISDFYENEFDFNMSNYSSGIYFIEVNTNKGTIRKKIVKT